MFWSPLNMEFWVDNFFHLTLEKYIPFSGIHVSWWEIRCHPNSFSPIGEGHFSLTAFKSFSLFTVFRSWIMMCLRVYIFEFSLFGVYSASWCHKFKSLAKFGELLAIILVPFQPCPLSSLLLGLSDMSVRSSVTVSQAPEALFSLPDPQFFFFLLFQCCIILWFSSSLILSSDSSVCALSF